MEFPLFFLPTQSYFNIDYEIFWTIIWLINFIIIYYLAKILTNYLSISPNDQEEFCNKFCSTIHAIISCYYSTLVWFLPESQMVYEKYQNEAQLPFITIKPWQYCICIILGYILYDTLRIFKEFLMIKRSNPFILSPSIIFHHLTVGIVFLISLNWKYGNFYLLFTLLNEYSTPFLNNRYFLQLFNLKHTKLYFINNLLFALMFFLCRIVLNSYLNFIIHKNIDKYFDYNHGLPLPVLYSLPILNWAHYFLQVYWFYLIIRMIINGKSKKKSN